MKQLYLIMIEPIFNQGVEPYCMITNNINMANIFRHELFKYRNYLLQKNNYDYDELAGYYFEEIIYKITNKNKEKTYYDGYLISYDKRDTKNYIKLKDVNWDMEQNNTEIEKDIVKICLSNYVFYSDRKKKHIDKFNILLFNNIKIY